MIEKLLRKTPFCLEYKDDEDNEFICYFDSFKQLMYHAAKEIAFAETKKIVWDEYYDEWDH